MTHDTTLLVYFDGEQVATPRLMGTLTGTNVRGKELFSFEFEESWLKDKTLRSFDPDLQLYSGRQYAPQGKDTFGIFLDSTPDRWGRMLLDRRELIRAREEGRSPRSLFETDYLMGVYDESRMGALRLKRTADGPFLDDDSSLCSPPWTSLRDLEYAALQIEQDPEVNDSRWLRMLIHPGSSLGGARPKANVLDAAGHPWIAKFPSRNDRKDVGAWEAVCMELARRCGITVSEWKLLKLNSPHHTFLSKRFDRTDTGRRLQFTSAMTLLGYTDGADATTGASYLELAEWIMQNCYDVERNLRQLYTRIAFNVAVSNCDDHLRNHGFLYTPKGWTLSPAYDLTPDAYGTDLKLCINETDSALDYALVLSIAPYLGIPVGEAQAILATVQQETSRWRTVATSLGIPRSEQEQLQPAFDPTRKQQI